MTKNSVNLSKANKIICAHKAQQNGYNNPTFSYDRIFLGAITVLTSNVAKDASKPCADKA